MFSFLYGNGVGHVLGNRLVYYCNGYHTFLDSSSLIDWYVHWDTSYMERRRTYFNVSRCLVLDLNHEYSRYTLQPSVRHNLFFFLA